MKSCSPVRLFGDPPTPTTTTTIPHKEEQQGFPTIHNAICDVCDMQIVGVRWKCLNCADYDLCDTCEQQSERSFNSTHQHHDPTHCFLRVVNQLPSQRQSSDLFLATPLLTPQDLDSVVHRNVFCSWCSSPVIGCRWLCINCPFSLCDSCFFAAVDEKKSSACHHHDKDHLFVKLPFAPSTPVPSLSLPVVYKDVTAATDTTKSNRRSTLQRSSDTPFTTTAAASTTSPTGDQIASLELVVMGGGKQVFVRPAEIEDIDGIMAVEVCSFKTPYSPEYFYISDNKAVFVAEDLEAAGGIVGYISVETGSQRSPAAYITSLAVGKEHRGLKIGHNLMCMVLQHCLQLGKKKVFLHCSVWNGSALKLYHSLGFKPTRWVNNYYSDENEDAVIMMKQF